MGLFESKEPEPKVPLSFVKVYSGELCRVCLGHRYEINQEHVEATVRAWMEHAGCSVELLAECSGMKRTTLSSVLNGQRKWTGEMIQRIQKGAECVLSAYRGNPMLATTRIPFVRPQVPDGQAIREYDPVQPDVKYE